MGHFLEFHGTLGVRDVFGRDVLAPVLVGRRRALFDQSAGSDDAVRLALERRRGLGVEARVVGVVFERLRDLCLELGGDCVADDATAVWRT